MAAVVGAAVAGGLVVVEAVAEAGAGEVEGRRGVAAVAVAGAAVVVA
jgi:hypothetical protein